MPKVVDHDLRREEIAAGLWRIVQRDGLSAVSVRSVARESGHSPSSLRHYFASQSELLEFALTSMLARTRARIEERIAAYDDTLDTVPWLAGLFKEGVPLDEQRAAEVDVWMALREQSRTSAQLASAVHREWRESRELCRFAVTLLAERQVRVDVAVPLPEARELESALLHIFWDGLVFEARSIPALLAGDAINEVLIAYLRQVESRVSQR